MIDGKSVFYRGFYAMSNLSLPDGTPTGAVYGFTSILLAALAQLKPDNVYIAWDKSKTNIRKRVKMYPFYKAGRKSPPADFYEQIPLLKEVLEAFGFPFLECDDYEADDIIGALAVQAVEQGGQVDLVTSDLDMLQLINHQVKVYALKTGFSRIDEYDEAFFETKHGLKIEQFLDYKALVGDTSDNIPGVPGIGIKTATELLNKYQTLDKVYDHLEEIRPAVRNKLEAGRELALLSKELARIWTDAPVELDWNQGRVMDIDADRVLAILDKFAFRTLATRAKKMFAKSPTKTGQGSLFDLAAGVDQAPVSTTIKIKKITKNSDLRLEISTWSSQEILVGNISQKVYLAAVDGQAWLEIEAKDLGPNWRAWAKGRTLIFIDPKQFLHDYGQAVLVSDLTELPFEIEQVYDLRQAEFLIDPLERESRVDDFHLDKLEDLQAIYHSQAEFFGENPRVLEVAQTCDFPLAPILFLIEQRGVKIDLATFTKLSKELSEIENDLSAEIYELAGRTFNINSPAQLSEVLYTDLGLPTAGIKKTKTSYSTGKKELDKLFDQHPIIAKIMDLREVSKIKSTYVDALPKLVDKNSRLHTTFTQNVTATGRLSSVNPNLQNIPTRTDLGQLVREGFVAGKDKVLISADYAQFELRLAAVLSGDQDMLEVFNAGRDIHQETAADIYGIKPEKVTKEQRRVAKIVNFSVLYGAGPRNLTQTVRGMSFAEAKQLIDRYFETRKAVRDFMDETLKQAENDGFVETYFGRRRPTPDIRSSNFVVREAAKRASVNMPIQGTGADLMKRAMIKVERELLKFKTAQQILQIHDSILIECSPKEAEQVAKVVEETMEDICPELKIHFDVDTNIGQNWSQL